VSAATTDQHLCDDELRRLSFGEMTTGESLGAQRHLFGCGPCLKRLIAIEVLLNIAEPAGPPDASILRDRRRPLYIRHDTPDGFVYSRVERSGRAWCVRHWGDELNGSSEWRTMREANTYAIEAFRQMFPEHRCTERCVVDPAE
jgi:hypothetical protein